VASYDVLAAVSETLQNRLTAGLSTLGPPVPVAEVHDLASLPTSAPPRATLFLYDVVQEPTVRNRPKSTQLVGGTLVERKQPLGLCLHYLITAWGGDRATEQQILGRVMQVMYDDAVIDGVELAGPLAGTAAQLRVSLLPMQLEDRARVWSAIGQPYRLSMNYEVRVVDIDPFTESSLKQVLARQIDAGVPS
jgi:Pvc16 N-terminal domain